MEGMIEGIEGAVLGALLEWMAILAIIIVTGVWLFG